MPESVGYVGDAHHDQAVRNIEEQWMYFRDLLREPYQDMVRWWKLYLAKKEDRRGPDEQWRANVFVPYPYSGVETRTAALTDIFSSGDPLVQAEGIGDEDQENAKQAERLVDYTFRKNQWRSRSENMFRTMGIQGTVPFKVLWTTQAHTIYVTATGREYTAFANAINEARANGAKLEPPDATLDPQGFEVWRQLVRDGGYGSVPPPPYTGEKRVVRYTGPWIERLSLFDLFYDPTVECQQDGYLIVHRVVKPLKWVLDRCQGENQRFDIEQVEKAGQAWDQEKFAQEMRDVAGFFKIGVSSSKLDPIYQDGVELWECFCPQDEAAPYKVIMNRRAVINTDTAWPYAHGEVPIHFLRNVAVEGFQLGISELQEPEALYYEMNSLRSLRLDGVTLSTIPIFGKVQGMGLPELVRKVKPGAFWDVSRADGVFQVNKGGVPEAAFREMFEIKADIDETNSTPPQLRGGASTVGRVSATETERRLSQAQLRVKIAAGRLEDEIHPAIRQIVFLWYERTETEELRVKIGGKGEGYLTIGKEELLQALDYDLRFRGATRATNRDMMAQQIVTFYDKFGSILIPEEVRNLAKKYLEIVGQKGIGDIISDKGTAQLVAAAQQQQAAQAAQAQQGQDAADAAAVQVPAEVSAEMAQALEVAPA